MLQKWWSWSCKGVILPLMVACASSDLVETARSVVEPDVHTKTEERDTTSGKRAG